MPLGKFEGNMCLRDIYYVFRHSHFYGKGISRIEKFSERPRGDVHYPESSTERRSFVIDDLLYGYHPLADLSQFSL